MSVAEESGESAEESSISRSFTAGATMQPLLELRSVGAIASEPFNSHGKAEKRTLSRNFAPVKLPQNRKSCDGLAIRSSANSNGPVANALNPPLDAAPKSGGPGPGYGQTNLGLPTTGAMEVGGFSIEGVSVGGQETCVMLPAFKVAFDIGRCPKRAVEQEHLLITHAHMDHIGGLTMYIASRAHLKRKVPTVIVPNCIKPVVEELLAVQRRLDDSPLPVNLIGMEIGGTYNLGKGYIVKAFKTYHVVPSQGYVIYSVKDKLKAEYAGLPGKELKALRMSGVQLTESVQTPEVAFTGDTTCKFFLDPANEDILKAKLLIVESTFLDEYMSLANATEYGHMHLFQILEHAEIFKNHNIVLIHFSARYSQKAIFEAIEKIPSPLKGRVHALTEGFTRNS